MVQLGPFGPIQLIQLMYFRLFSPVWSICLTSIYFGAFKSSWSIRFCSILVGLLWSIPSNLVNPVHFGLIRSTLVSTVQFSLLRFVLSNWFIRSPFWSIWPIWSHLVHIGPIWFNLVYSIHFSPFGIINSDSLWSICCTYLRMRKDKFGLRVL